MRKNRFLLCFLLALAIVYYGGSRLPLGFSGVEGIYTVSWTVFALLVLAGNLSGLIGPAGSSKLLQKANRKENRRIRSKQY